MAFPRLIFSLLFLIPAALHALSSGEYVGGTISSIGQIDSHTIEATYGETIRIQVGEGPYPSDSARIGYLDAVVELVAPSGGIVVPFTDSSISHKAVETGTYTIRIGEDGNDKAGADYWLTTAVLPRPFEDSSDSGTAVNGTVHTGTLPPGDIDLRRFSVKRGDSIRIGCAPTGDYNTNIELYDPEGQLIEEVSNMVFGAPIDTLALISGTYTAVVSSAVRRYETPYLIQIFTMPGTLDTGDHVHPLPNGLEQPGSLGPGESDAWTFTATRGEPLHIAAGISAGSAAFDLRMELFGPKGNLLSTADGRSGVSLEAMAPLDGTYVVLLSDNNKRDSAEYLISFAAALQAPDPAGDGGALANGEDIAANFSRSEFDMWTIEAGAADIISFGIGEVSGAVAATVRLYDPDGQLVAPASSYTTSTSARYEYLAPISGRYAILLYNVLAGDYLVSSLVLPGGFVASDDNGTLESGVAVSGSNERGDYDVRAFNAIAGDSLEITLVDLLEDSYRPFIRLVNENGLVIQQVWGNTTASVTHQVLVSGTYYAIISDRYNQFPGDYNVTATGFTGEPYSTDLEPVPTLEINQLQNGDIQLSWPDNTDFVLEEATGEIESWQPTGQGDTDGTTRTRTFTPSGSGFFRLNDNP